MDAIQLDELAIFDEKDTIEIPPVTPPEEDLDEAQNDPPKAEEPVEPQDPPKDEGTGSEEMQATYDLLKSTGYLDVPEDFEFDGTPEKMEEAIQLSESNKYKKVANDLWNRLPDDFKPVLQYALAGGSSVQEFLAAQNYDLDDSDISEPEVQKQVVEQYYKLISKQSDEKIKKQIRRLEDMGDLEEEAGEAIEYLKNFKQERQQQLLLQAEAEAERRKEEAEAQLQAITKAIGGFEAEEERKNRIKSFFFGQVKDQGRVTTQFDKVVTTLKNNPEHLVQLADILLEYDPSKGFNFERFTRKGKTQANKDFKQTLEEKITSKSKLGGGSSVNSPSDFDFDWNAFNRL